MLTFLTRAALFAALPIVTAFLIMGWLHNDDRMVRDAFCLAAVCGFLGANGWNDQND